jgi:hypothetical protein
VAGVAEPLGDQGDAASLRPGQLLVRHRASMTAVDARTGWLSQIGRPDDSRAEESGAQACYGKNSGYLQGFSYFPCDF